MEGAISCPSCISVLHGSIWKRAICSSQLLPTSVLALALGIGASAAIFALVHAILMRSPPINRTLKE